jgi:hypothetical protein
MLAEIFMVRLEHTWKAAKADLGVGGDRKVGQIAKPRHAAVILKALKSPRLRSVPGP